MSELLNDNNLTSAIELLAKGEISQYKADKTVEGVIFSIVNVVTGEYKVRYQDSVWSAFSQGKTKYKIGDNVLVKIPLGDFSNKKYIDGYVYNSDLKETNAAAQVEESYSPDWSNIYKQENWLAEKGLIAYSGENHKSSVIIFEADIDSPSHNLFKQYANKGTEFRITADFMTTFVNEHTAGNYGLRLLFETSREKDNGYEDVVYTFDSSQFNGNPYRTSSWTPQSLLLTVPKRYLTKLKRIEFFQEGFADYDPTSNQTNVNIFMRNLQIEWINVRDITEYQYYLTIAAPQGFVFLDEVYPSLTLQAKLMSGAENLIDKSSCSCLWYIEDPSILIDSTEYEKAAGTGWKRVFKDSFDTVIISRTANKIPSVKYKVIVIYKKEYIFSEEITLIDLNSQYDLFLELENDTFLTIKNKKELENPVTLVGDWYVELPDGSRLKASTERVSIQDFSNYFIYPWIKVLCDVYEGTTRIGTVEWTNFKSKDENEELPNFMLQYKGDDVFHYDANGDIFDINEYDDIEHKIECSIVSNQSEALTYSIKWLDSTKQPIKEQPRDLDNSMTKQMWVDQNNALRFKIKTKYYDMFTNNSVYVRITALDGTFVDYEKQISFLKDGAQGTNGTTYVCLIRPINANGEKIIGKNLGLDYINTANTNGWGDTSINYKIFVYCNGAQINTIDYSNKFHITYKWEGCNVTLNSLGTDKSVVKITPLPTGGISYWNKDQYVTKVPDGNIIKSPLELKEFYIKCQATIQAIDEGKKKGNTSTVYAYQPIDIYVGNINKDYAEIVVPNFLMYSASGFNPQYDSKALEFKYYNVATDSKELGRIKSQSDYLGTWSVGGKDFLLPASHFIGDNNSVGTLQLILPNQNDSPANYILHSVFMYLNPYGNEAINSWDGTSINIDNDKHIILAPQIGAGSKNNENQFSGVVMGKDSIQDKTGLYGYQNGVNTFALKENGEATFGSKQQITLNGETAQITGKNAATDNSDYMTINLVNLGKGTYAIQIGDKFLVGYEGNLVCTNANVTGTINATSGTIGGCNINNGVLQVGKANITEIDASSIKSGTLDCGQITVSGLTANSIQSGTLGGDVIYAGTISASNITGGTLQADVIYGGTVYASNIVGGNTGGYIASGVISSASHSLDELNVTNLTANSIGCGTTIRVGGASGNVTIGGAKVSLISGDNIVERTWSEILTGNVKAVFGA